jgi:ABC-type sulfate transport system permease component
MHLITVLVSHDVDEQADLPSRTVAVMSAVMKFVPNSEKVAPAEAAAFCLGKKDTTGESKVNTALKVPIAMPTVTVGLRPCSAEAAGVH